MRPRDALPSPCDAPRDALRDVPCGTLDLVVISLDPVILSIGPLALRWFGLLALLGLGLAVGLTLRELERQHLGRKLALDALAWGLPLGLLSARLVHVLSDWDYYLMRPSELWLLNVDGLSLWGGLLGGALIAAARLGGDAYKRRQILDAAAPNAALGIALGQLGAFLDGHGQGLPSQLPWATLYTNPLAASPDFGVPRHPLQLYDALVALALFATLRWLLAARTATRARAEDWSTGPPLAGAAAIFADGSPEPMPAEHAQPSLPPALSVTGLSADRSQTASRPPERSADPSRDSAHGSLAWCRA